MKPWLASHNVAVSLSFVALIIQIFRALLDFAIVFPIFAPTNDLKVIGAAVYTSLFGIWSGGLLLALANRRAGLIAAFVVGLLFWLGVDWMTVLPVMCPNGCDTIWFYIAAGAGLVIGGLALIALAFQIWRRPQSTAASASR